ncbi:uncharacterized protein LOC132543258 [Ylistrum balloti]|uniref:uncharacterized protein LOC132543258 n=1 Tax=Ylistrum balloti TaxID=509963 RepID=UPI0029058BB7|nr:uncharacterized protein LOC132543258 [Ylistrum balloti]
MKNNFDCIPVIENKYEIQKDDDYADVVAVVILECFFYLAGINEKSPSSGETNLLDLEIDGLKQHIDNSIKRHMDIRSDIRKEVDMLRQENMDFAAMLHRTDETFYLHQDIFEEVNRLRSMNVRLKAMLCLDGVKSIEAFGVRTASRTYPKYVQPRLSHASPITPQTNKHDICTNRTGESSHLFERIDKLESEMKNFLSENLLHERKETHQPKHVLDVGMRGSVESTTNSIRNLPMDDNNTIKPRTVVNTKDKQGFDRMTDCDADKRTKVHQCKCQTIHHEIKSDEPVDGPHTYSTFWIKNPNLLCDKMNTGMNFVRSTAESASPDDRNINMNSSRSDDRSGNTVIVSSSRPNCESVVHEDMKTNTNDSKSKIDHVLHGNRNITVNSPRKLESMLILVHPKRSESGTMIGFDVAENFENTAKDKNKPFHHQVKSTYCEPTQPSFHMEVSDLVPSSVGAHISVEDLEIRDIYKDASNDTENSITPERTLKFSTPYKVVSTRHIRPREVPRLNMGDLVSVSDVNIAQVTEETIEDLLYDPDCSVSYIDISDGSGCKDSQTNPAENFVRCESTDNAPADPELEVLPNDLPTGNCALDNTSTTYEKATWNDTPIANSKHSSPACENRLQADAHQLNWHNVNAYTSHTGENLVPNMPTEGEEDRYAHYLELCNTTMKLTSIIQDMCANKSIQRTDQEFLQHLNQNEELYTAKLGISSENVVAVESDPDVVQLDKNNFPWLFPHVEERENCETNDEEDAIDKERSTLHVTVPYCTMDSARSDVSCADLNVDKESPNLGSTRREHYPKVCLITPESPRVCMEETFTTGTETWNDVIDTDQLIVPSELSLSCKRRQSLSISLSESHEDVVRLLNWTNEATATDSSEEKYNQYSSPQNQRSNPWFKVEYNLDDGEQTDSYFSDESPRSGYEADSDISCIDLREEVKSVRFAEEGHVVKEFLRYSSDETDISQSPRFSTSVTSSDEITYFTDSEETNSSYITASEDDSVTDGLDSPDSLVGYARRNQMWEENFVVNYMNKTLMEQENNEQIRLLVDQANEDIAKIHAIRIPILLAKEDEYEFNGMGDESELVTETVDSARSDVSCIELSKEVQTFSELMEGHAVKEFMVDVETNKEIIDISGDEGESQRWAVPTTHKTYELAASGSSSSDDQVVLSDIENGDDWSDVTGNDVSSVKAFSDIDPRDFDKEDPGSSMIKKDGTVQDDVKILSTIYTVPRSDDEKVDRDIDLAISVVPSLSDLQKQGPRVSLEMLRKLNSKLENVKQGLLESSKMSKWLAP